MVAPIIRRRPVGAKMKKKVVRRKNWKAEAERLAAELVRVETQLADAGEQHRHVFGLSCHRGADYTAGLARNESRVMRDW